MLTLDAYVSPLGSQLWAVCYRCNRLHFHGNTGTGPRAPHCPERPAPMYKLRVVGPAPDEWLVDPVSVRPRSYFSVSRELKKVSAV